MTPMRNNTVGRYGEDVAAAHLIDAGMIVLDRNWRGPAGEIDLVLRDGNTLVFCEVKTRSSEIGGHPLEAVSEIKVARLRRLAAQWLDNHDVHPRDVRLDMVGVVRPRRGAALVDHVRGIG